MTESPPLNLQADLDLEPPDKTTLNFAQRQGDKISSQGIALLGIMGFLLGWMVITSLEIHQISLLIIDFIFFTATPMVLAGLIGNEVYSRFSTGLESVSKPVHWQRCRVKFIGFSGTIFLLGLLYWKIPEYSRSFYQPVWEVSVWMALPILGIAFPYIVWVDRRMRNAEDGYYHTGLFLLGKWHKVDYRELRCHGLNWLVKGFFMPFMLAGTAERLNVLVHSGIDFSSFGHLYTCTVNLAYTIDIMFGVIGYLLTLRIIDSHIQSVEPTLLGWMSTVCCYAPFATLVWSSAFLNYKGKTDWSDWLAHYPIIFITWGFFIMVLHGIYVWSTCSFGYRFSNLTNRGIIVNGPYRYLKHPAYLSKNLAWWLMSVPFVAHHTWLDATRACLCLLLTNLIYGLRALTEERHLLRDPAYQAYHAWMEEHGLGAQIRILWKKMFTIRTLAMD